MDVTAIETVSEDEGTFVHFKTAAGELLFDVEGEGEAATQKPVGAVVSGSYSKAYKTAQRKVKDRNLKALRRSEEFDSDTFDRNELELEVACIRSWTFTTGGQPFPITVNNWHALIERQPQWQDQVEKAMNDHARFFPTKSTG